MLLNVLYAQGFDYDFDTDTDKTLAWQGFQPGIRGF